MERTLIIAYNGSDNSADALALGRTLAEMLEARPLVVAVMDYPDHLVVREELEASLNERAEAVLEDARGRLAPLEVETRALPEVSVARALDRLTGEIEPVALVIGSSHRGRVGRLLVGSVGGALLSGAPCPIAVAPAGYAGSEPGLHRFGVAANDSPESWVALEAAGRLASRSRGSLTVLSVIEPIHYGLAAAYPVIDEGEYEAEARAALDRSLEPMLGRVASGVPVERRTMLGAPADLIAQAAADVDLLIVGSRGYGPVRRVMLGGVSAKLVSTAPCPVLVLPRDSGTDPLRLTSLGERAVSTEASGDGSD